MEELGLNSRAYYLWSEGAGEVILEKDSTVETPVASLTKLMTALVTVERWGMDEVVTITPEMLAGLEEFAVVGLVSGQEVTVEELLQATMLPSAGDAAQALAISTAGSIEEFAELMNERAGEIGMERTHFSNPVGFDEENYSTPEDVAKLLKEALKNEEFRRFFENFEADLPVVGKRVEKTFVKTGPILGGKTGFTNAAGRCLASTAEIEGEKYILVTVGAEDGQHVADAKKVYDYVEAKYEPLEVVREGEWIVRLPVRQSETGKLEFLADETEVKVLEEGVRREDLIYKYEGATEITRETEQGAKLGEWAVYQGERKLYGQEIYLEQEVEFYPYSELIIGGGASLILLVAGVWSAWRGWRGKAKRKSWRIWRGAAIALFGGLLVSLAVNVGMWKRWQADGGGVEVNEMRGIEKENEGEESGGGERQDGGEDAGSEKGEENGDGAQGVEEPGESGGVSLGNCTMKYGNLMLINPNFMVDENFIAGRQVGLVSVSQTYGIPEYNRAGNGDNLMVAEAAEQLAKMVEDYKAANPGHEMGTYSCFRARGTTCGRLCAATGASDHHTGLTCDLIDLSYGSVLDTDDYADHAEWQWLKENSYKYGFIDRFPEAWAGGSMAEPLNVDAEGSTGLFETWHYRYVGVTAATEIATGKYNGGNYDSLEHYLKVTGRVQDLKNGICRN